MSRKLNTISMSDVDDMVTDAILKAFPYPCDEALLELQGMSSDEMSNICANVQNLENGGWLKDWTVDEDVDQDGDGMIVINYQFLDAMDGQLTWDCVMLFYMNINELKEDRKLTGNSRQVTPASDPISDYDRAMGILE